MALTSADITALTSFSWAEIKKAARVCITSNLLGGSSLTINGRQIARVSVAEAKKIYEWADAMETIDATGADAAGIALIEFGEAQ